MMVALVATLQHHPETCANLQKITDQLSSAVLLQGSKRCHLGNKCTCQLVKGKAE
jgi:hypothetical protein